MDWKNTKNELPLAYRTGDWDGKNSDEVIAEDNLGKKYLAVYCEGKLDSTEFKDWYDSDGFSINKEIVRWLEIP